MRNTLLLIQNYFLCFLGRINGKKGNAKKFGFGVGLILLFGFIFVFMFVNLAILTTETALQLEDPKIALYSNASMAVIFSLLIMVTKSTFVGKNSDEDMLISLPVTKNNIIVAKVFYDFLFDLAIVIITIIPAYIVYYIMVPSTSIFLVVRSFIVCLLIPLFLGSMGYFLSLFFNWIASKFKYYNIVQTIFNIIFLLAFMICYYGLTIFSSKDTAAGSDILLKFAPIRWLVSFIADGSFISLGFIFLVTVFPFIISIIIKSKMFGITFAKYKGKETTIKYEQSSVIKSLYKRELTRYFNIPTYVVNTIFGGILIVIFAITLIVIGKDYILNMAKIIGLGDLDRHLVVIVIIINCIMSAEICTTSCSISIEGKTLWILKAHPISEKAIFISKVLLNITIAFPFIVVSGFLLAITLGFENLPFLILIPLITVLTSSMSGLIINLIYPKFDFVSETVVVKQSMSVGISAIYNIVISIIPFIIYFVFNKMINKFIILTLIIFICLLICGITYLYLLKKGKKLYQKIND